MKALQDLLDNLPVATLTYLAGIVVTCIAYANGNVDFQDALVALGVLGGGTAGIGFVRNQAGKGVKKARR